MEVSGGPSIASLRELAMMNSRIFVVVVALAAGSLTSAAMAAQTLPEKFRGMYVCGKLPTRHGILRVPLDLAIDGNNVHFARPLFDVNGTRVMGSELGKGTIDDDGKVHVTSDWSYLGDIAHAEYTGTLTASGGTLTGTQIWTRPGVMAPVGRTCTAALVPAPKFAPVR